MEASDDSKAGGLRPDTLERPQPGVLICLG